VQNGSHAIQIDYDGTAEVGTEGVFITLDNVNAGDTIDLTYYQYRESGQPYVNLQTKIRTINGFSQAPDDNTSSVDVDAWHQVDLTLTATANNPVLQIGFSAPTGVGRAFIDNISYTVQ